MDTYPLYPYLGSKTKCEEKPVAFPPQHQDIQPGLEYIMSPRPIYENPSYRGSNKLSGRVAVITGGDIAGLEGLLLSLLPRKVPM